MKKFLISGFFSFLFSFCFLSASSMDISVTYAAFQNEQGKYVEVHLYVVGSTVEYDTLVDGSIQASVEITITFNQEGNIVNYDKFTLNSPINTELKDFMAVKRFALKNGDYQMKVFATDLNLEENNFDFDNTVKIDFDQRKVQLSGIQLLSAYSPTQEENEYTKNGFFLEPAAFNFYPKNLEQLAFYLEVYNPSEDPFKAAYLRYAIYKKVAENNSELIIQKYKKLSAKGLQAMILQIPINDMESGNFELLVELRNKEKMLVDAKSNNFQRSNPVKDIEQHMSLDPSFEQSFTKKLSAKEVRYALKAIAPICKGPESVVLEQILYSSELPPRQYFLHKYFWEMLPSNPTVAYEQFMKVANAVDETYRSNVGYGFETDRGIIFLKYGKPTEMVHVEDEPSAPPYEIWFYDRLEDSKQYNVKFIFHNPSLANNDFVLLHSNCRGERYNPRWEVELYRHAPNEQSGQNAASTTMDDNYRRNARRIWEEL